MPLMSTKTPEATPEQVLISLMATPQILKKFLLLAICAGGSLVVWAIRQGRQAARAVDEFLMGESDCPGEAGLNITYPARSFVAASAVRN